jgi:hypothetical protein
MKPSRPVASLLVLSSLLVLFLTPRLLQATTTTYCQTGNFSMTCTGGAPTLQVNNSGGLSHPEIVPIFWGTTWGTGTDRDMMMGALQTLVSGPYFGALSQYGANGQGVELPRVTSVSAIQATTPTLTCSSGASCSTTNPCADKSLCGAADAIKVINGLIGSNAIPGPMVNTPTLDKIYLLVVPSNWTGPEYNAPGTCDSTCGGLETASQYHFALVQDQDTAAMSHELVESIAGNVSVTGCEYFNNSLNQFSNNNLFQTTATNINQIADPCCFNETQSGYQVAAYWSQKDGRCVIPEAWPGVWKFDGASSSWTQIADFEVRQAYSAGDVVIVTDKTDNLLTYGGVPNAWTKIGGPGAMFGIVPQLMGTNGYGVVGIDPVVSGISIYSSSTGSWSSAGLLSGGVNAVYGGTNPLATDATGALWMKGAFGWSRMGDPADQFVGTSIGVLSVPPGKGVINQLSSSGWVPVENFPVTEIFGNPASSLAAFTGNDSTRDVSAGTLNVTPGTNWAGQGRLGNMFAVGNEFFELAPDRSAIFESTNAAASFPPFTDIRTTPTGRLIGANNSGGLYATGCAGDTGVCVAYDPPPHGFMIQSDRNTALAINAINGAAEGVVPTLMSVCTSANSDCTWSYQHGMILSDTDPTLAINATNGAAEGTILHLTRACVPTNLDCTWTYSHGEFLSDRDPTLAINAGGGAKVGTQLVLTRSCSSSNPDCTWTMPHVVVSSDRDYTLAVNAFDGAKNPTNLLLNNQCDPSNTDCTWTFTKGMIFSDTNATLAMNAYLGARDGAQLQINNLCTVSNPDCTWTWSHGEIFSDDTAGGTFPVNAVGGARQLANLALAVACNPSNPDCIFDGILGK